MTPRHILLVAAAIAVLGAGVYLFMEVRSGSAAAVPTEVAQPPKAPDKEPAVAAAQPAPVVKHAMPAPAPAPSTPTAAPTAAPALEAPHDEPALIDERANPKAESIMDQANKAYDRQDYDEAKAIAGKVLVKMPNNVRMLRIMVSSSCIDGDVAVAQKYFPSLPKFDRDQMKARCDRYGVTLTDPPQ